MVVPAGRSGPTVVVLPGPPRELHAMWHEAGRDRGVPEAAAGRDDYEQDMLRLFGIPESEIAETLRVAEAGDRRASSALEITTCLRRGEVEVVVAPRAGGRGGLATRSSS